MSDSTVNFEPLSDFLLIEPIQRAQTAGGVALPEGVDTDPLRGKIVKAGPGRITEEGALIPPAVKAGDIVYLMFAYQQPIWIQFGGKKYIIVRARDCIGLAPSSESLRVQPAKESSLTLAV